MRNSPDDLRRATGYKLSETQADALCSLRYWGSKAMHYNTWRSLKAMGLITQDRKLTPEGTRAAELLTLACEIGASHAEHARLGLAGDWDYETCPACNHVPAKGEPWMTCEEITAMYVERKHTADLVAFVESEASLPETITPSDRVFVARQLGVSLYRNTLGEWKVNLKGGSEGTAYYTHDVRDALETARSMSRRAALPLCNRCGERPAQHSAPAWCDACRSA